MAFLQEHGLVQPFHSEDAMSETDTEAKPPQIEDYEALVADLQDQLTRANAALAEFTGPQYAGLCQFRAADGRICLTLMADGRLKRGEGFPTDDAASVAFFDSMARNIKGHLNDRHLRAVAAETEAKVQRDRAESLATVNTMLRQQAEASAGERLNLRHQVAVAEAKAEAMAAAR